MQPQSGTLLEMKAEYKLALLILVLWRPKTSFTLTTTGKDQFNLSTRISEIYGNSLLGTRLILNSPPFRIILFRFRLSMHDTRTFKKAKPAPPPSFFFSLCGNNKRGAPHLPFGGRQYTNGTHTAVSMERKELKYRVGGNVCLLSAVSLKKPTERGEKIYLAAGPHAARAPLL